MFLSALSDPFTSMSSFLLRAALTFLLYNYLSIFSYILNLFLRVSQINDLSLAFLLTILNLTSCSSWPSALDLLTPFSDIIPTLFTLLLRVTPYNHMSYISFALQDPISNDVNLHHQDVPENPRCVLSIISGPHSL